MRAILGTAAVAIAFAQMAQAETRNVTADQCARLAAQVEAMTDEIERDRETIAALRRQTVRLMGSADTEAELTDSKNVVIASFKEAGSDRPSVLPVVEEICGVQ